MPLLTKHTPIIVVLSVWAAIAVTVYCLGWQNGWSVFGISSMEPAFADLRSVQAGIAAAADGLNPQIQNPEDPWGRAMNYPLAWLAIAKTLNWTNEINYLASVSLILAAFAASAMHLITKNPSLWIAAAAISGSSLLLFERGNSDALIFCLIYISLRAQSKIFQTISLTLSVFLKIYPIYALTNLSRINKQYVINLLFCFIIIIYLIPEIRTISLATPQTAFFSYGSGTISSALSKKGIDLPAFLVSILIINLGCIVSIFINKINIEFPQDYRESLYLVGSAIYCGTFIAGSNFDYRMIFLILTIPFVCSIGKYYLRLALLIFTLLAMNENILLALFSFYGSYVGQICKVILAVLHIALLINIIIRRIYRESLVVKLLDIIKPPRRTF